MGGGGPPETSTTTTGFTIPPELRPLYSSLSSTLTGAMPGLGQILSSSMEFNPQRIPGLRPSEREWRRDVMGMVGPAGLTESQREARRALRTFTSGEPGQSAATQAAMEAFKTQQLPQILQGSAVAGLGQGAIAEAAAQAAQSAYVPLAQQDLANRMAAAQSIGNIGAQGYAQNVGLQGILGMPREIRGQRGQAGYTEQLRLQDLASSFLLGPFGQLAQPGSTQRVVNTGGGK